jgi:molybdenum cofactor cytidylyltransferase
MISAVVLAAGLSTRMGRLKQLLPYGEHTVIEQVVATLLASPVQDVLVVTGHERAQIDAVLENWSVRVVFNPGYAEGEMLSSVQGGLRALPSASQAALLVLGDMPGLDVDVIRLLVQTYLATGDRSIYIPSYRMRAGHPVLVPRPFWQAILEAPRQASLRSVLRGPDTPIIWVEVDTASVLRDVDTPDDYEQELRRLGDTYDS